ncbi:Crp/Fnr family transcriptional regulator [Chitinophaga lutea]
MSESHPHCFLCKYSIKEWHSLIELQSEIVSFKKGQELFREGDAAGRFYFLHEGHVKVHKQWGTDKELIVRLAGPGDVLGHRGILPGQPYPVSATALEAGSACSVPIDFLMTSLTMNNQLAIQLMRLYAQELQTAEQNMRNLVHMDVKGRVALTLLNLRDRFGTDGEGNIQNILRKQDIASYAGTTYETLFKILQDLGAEGSVAVNGKHIRVLNEKALKSHILY